MTTVETTITQRWQVLPIADIVVQKRARKVSTEHVQQIVNSYQQLGGQLQLQPIVVDSNFVLIDGAHRLEAARIAGWSHISTLVFDGANASHRALLETEANRVRKNLTPLELEAVWSKHYEPVLREKARNRRLRGLQKRHEATVQGASVIENFNNEENHTAISIAEAAKQTTGLSLPTLKKITEIRNTANSALVPAAVKRQAEKALTMLSEPGAKVDPIYRQLMRYIGRINKNQETAAQTSARLAEQTLDRTVVEVSLFAERIAEKLGIELETLARTNDATKEQLRAVRVAFSHALARVVAIECLVTGQPRETLPELGKEVSKMLSVTTNELLKTREQTAAVGGKR